MYYKLTNENMQTYNDTQWVLNEWRETDGAGELCSDGWLHCYNDANLAILLNPIYNSFSNPRLFEIEVDGEQKSDHGLKFGYTKMRPVKELPVPNITIEQRVRFAILCAKQVCSDPVWLSWASNWLDGIDRTRSTAMEAARSARAVGLAAAAESATLSAAWEPEAWAAEAASWAAAWAAESAELDLIAIAKEAIC